MLAHRGSFSPKFNASGGTITTYIYSGITYAVHTFRSSGTFCIYKGSANSTHTLTCDILVLAGGGSAQTHGGGSGAGELVWTAAQALTMGSKTVTVGAGGPRASSSPAGYHDPAALSGGDSIYDPSGINIDANGGGGGGQHGGGNAQQKAGGAGGSSGGGSRDANNGTATPVVKLSSGLGNIGGVCTASSWGAGAGGGGAGSAGTNGSTSNGSGSDGSAPGNGGTGAYNFVASNALQTAALLKSAGVGVVVGADVYLAAGGGGCTADADQDAGGRGGVGGGGQGGTAAEKGQVHDGLQGTGSGGGARATDMTPNHHGMGGSGVVIIRYTI